MNTLDKFNKQDKEVIDIVNRNFAKVRHESIKQAQEQEKIKYQPRSKSKQNDFFKKSHYWYCSFTYYFRGWK